MAYLTDEELARFNLKWKPQGQCWVWQGPLDRDGYGTFFFRRKPRRAHRVAWFMQNGDLKPAHVVNHACRNRACVNPQHLNAIPSSENTFRDSVSIPYLNSQKTKCKNGHDFDRVYTRKDNGRSYRACSVCEKEKQSRLRKKWVAEDALNV